VFRGVSVFGDEWPVGCVEVLDSPKIPSVVIAVSDSCASVGSHDWLTISTTPCGLRAVTLAIVFHVLRCYARGVGRGQTIYSVLGKLFCLSWKWTVGMKR